MIKLTDNQLKDVAGQLEMGLKCYLHRQTGALVAFPDPDQFADIEGEVWQDEIEKIEASPEHHIEIFPMNSRESFRLMEQFVDEVPSESFRKRLLNALNRAKPFRNFKYEIDSSGEFRQLWFEFRDKQMVEWVANQLEEAD